MDRAISYGILCFSVLVAKEKNKLSGIATGTKALNH